MTIQHAVLGLSYLPDSLSVYLSMYLSYHPNFLALAVPKTGFHPPVPVNAGLIPGSKVAITLWLAAAAASLPMIVFASVLPIVKVA